MCNQITLKASVDEVASHFKARRPKPTNASSGDVWKGGTGFLFRPLDPAALVVATRRALDVWRDVRAWRGLQDRGMALDFSWGRSAERYAALSRGLAGASAPPRRREGEGESWK